MSLLTLASCSVVNEEFVDLSNQQLSNDNSDIFVVKEQRLQLNGNIDLENLPNYTDHSIPQYIKKDNTGTNEISNIEATLGRVLFYDKNLSSDRSISCS